MCLIIDANCLAKVFPGEGHPCDAAKLILNWLYERDGKVVYGGSKLEKEMGRVGRATVSLVGLLRAGRARRIAENLVDSEQIVIQRSGELDSDDPHIIALARVSGARTLYSEDQDLHKDFKNPRLLSMPRGCVFQTVNHVILLRHTRSCGV